MANYPNYFEIQKQNEMRKISEAQNRLAYLEQQSQMQNQNTFQNQIMNQPQVQFLGINGKIVPSLENITANDVPMDGSVAFFPRQDMSEIYAKSWNSDGTIRTIVFKPVLDGNPNNSTHNEEKLKIGLSDEATEAFMKRFDELEKRLDDFGLTLTKSSTKSSTSRTKKEADVE